MIENIKKIFKKLIINPEKYFTCIECEDKNVHGCHVCFIENKIIFNIWINQYEVEFKTSRFIEINSRIVNKDIGRHRVAIEYSDKDKFEIFSLICQLRDNCENVTNTYFDSFAND